MKDCSRRPIHLLEGSYFQSKHGRDRDLLAGHEYQMGLFVLNVSTLFLKTGHVTLGSVRFHEAGRTATCLRESNFLQRL